MTGIDVEDLRRVVTTALEEDLRYGPDETSLATVPQDAVVTASISPRAFGTLAGLPAALAVYAEIAGDFEVLSTMDDGARVRPGDDVLVVRALALKLLMGERTALNLLCHLSGVATATAEWVDAVAGTGVAIRDSRKTLPGLRLLEKYAVRCGGGVNHRLGLGDAILIKDNHVAAAGSVTAALRAAREHAPELPCEVEVDSLDQLDEALAEKAELVLLDNFTPEYCATAVRRVADLGASTKLEMSGGLKIADARVYAETGVDYLAVGALTHSAPALDLGLDLRID